MASQLKGIGTLFSETWEQYKVRALPILGVLLLATLLVFVLIAGIGMLLVLLAGGIGPVLSQVETGQVNVTIGLAIALLFVLSSVLILWTQSATMAVTVHEDLGVIEAMQVGWRKMWSMGWVLLLSGSIVMAGIMLFIIPGLIFSVWFILCVFVLYGEDRRGLDALAASRAYVRGHWWSTLFRFFLIWLLSVLIGLIPLIGQLLSFLFTPFFLLYMFLVYRDLKEAYGDKEIPAGGRFLWASLAFLGILVPLLGFLGAGVTLIPQLPQLMHQLQQRSGCPMPQQNSLPHPNVPAGPGGQDRPAPPPALVQPVPGQVQWRDPAGDVAPYGLSRWLDIRSVSAMGRDGSLVLDVELHTPLAAFFNAASTSSQSFAPLLTVYLDTDVDRRTGGKTAGMSERAGYDMAVEVVLEAADDAEQKGRIHASVYRLVNGQRVSVGAVPEEDIIAGSHGLKLRVPYGLLGLQSGGRLRLCYLESAQEQGGGLSKDSLVSLP